MNLPRPFLRRALRRVPRRRALLGLLVAGLSLGDARPALAAPRERATAPVVETDRVALPGHVHGALRASVDLGPVEPGLAVERLTLVLRAAPEQEADLRQFLSSVQRRGDPQYHRWLTPAGFGDRFGIAPGDRARLKAWLAAHQLTVDDEPAGGQLLMLHGTVAALENAFSVGLHRYRWHGELHVAASREPSVPRALAPVVRGFGSLHDFRRQPQLVRSLSRPGFTAGSTTFYLAPGDFATIYDLNGAYAQSINGGGRSIAVIGRSAVHTADLSQFRSYFGLSARLPTVIVNGPNPGYVTNDQLESDLDLEWSGAVAPGASVTFVTSRSTGLTDGVDLSASYAVSHNVADIISVSYGSCEQTASVASGTTVYNALWQQAAAQGISVLVSSGDSGAAGCDPASASIATGGLGINELCSSPYSTCVGGTQFTGDVSAPATYWAGSNNATTQASALSYIPEAVWNSSGSNLAASGGGASIFYAKPAWQLATGVPSDGVRDVPDVALSASGAHDAYLVWTSDGVPSLSLVGVGGTSASAPSFAGIAALVAQKQGGRLGNLNPTLYALSELQVAGGAAVFHRITSGNNSVPGQTGYSASAANPTYNQATGLGTVDGGLLISTFGQVTAPAYGLAPASTTVPPGQYVGSAVLTAAATTAWTAGSNAGWLTVTPTSGTGSAPLTYSVSPNVGSAARTGTITVAGQPLTVTQAAGSGGTGVLSVSSTTLGFGNDTVGQTTTGQRLIVSNTGSGPLTLGAIGLAGGAAGDYLAGGSCSAGLVLAPGASCYITVSFDATSAGARTASLSIAVAGGATDVVALSGTGVAVPSAVPSTDGPLPPWSYALLAVAFAAIGRRRLGTARR